MDVNSFCVYSMSKPKPVTPCHRQEAGHKMDDDEYKSSQNYYTLAHSYSESITEQPTTLCYGNLKEYQVCVAATLKSTRYVLQQP